VFPTHATCHIREKIWAKVIQGHLVTCKHQKYKTISKLDIKSSSSSCIQFPIYNNFMYNFNFSIVWPHAYKLYYKIWYHDEFSVNPHDNRSVLILSKNSPEMDKLSSKSCYPYRTFKSGISIITSLSVLPVETVLHWHHLCRR
jgi:hypothetical protein